MHIDIFTTGGSIDKGYSTRVSDFIVLEAQIGRLLQQANVGFTYTISELMRKDSLAITDADRQLIADRVATSPHRLILITHGTDTMAQTGLALQQIPDKVIVITGAMQPATAIHSDAAFNVGSAVAALQCKGPGVYIAMSGRIFPADQARKNADKDQFEAL